MNLRQSGRESRTEGREATILHAKLVENEKFGVFRVRLVTDVSTASFLEMNATFRLVKDG